MSLYMLFGCMSCFLLWSSSLVIVNASEEELQFEPIPDTTYCWLTRFSAYDVLSELDTPVPFSGEECPLELNIEMIQKDIYPMDVLHIEWNANLRKGTLAVIWENKLEMEHVYDSNGNQYVQILQSHLQTCSEGSNCSPFQHGEKHSTTINQVSNFTKVGTSKFTSTELAYLSPGKYSLFAHIVLPAMEAESERLDFAVYLPIEVRDHKQVDERSIQDSGDDISQHESTGANEKSSRMSTEVQYLLVICGVVIGISGVVAFVVFRNRGKHARKNTHGSTARNTFDVGFDAFDQDEEQFTTTDIAVLGREDPLKSGSHKQNPFLSSTSHITIKSKSTPRAVGPIVADFRAYGCRVEHGNFNLGSDEGEHNEYEIFESVSQVASTPGSDYLNFCPSRLETPDKGDSHPMTLSELASTRSHPSINYTSSSFHH